ncbi:MAG: copper resistance protein [Azospirillum sp.]|nr:copper resistance protein [Azospirillum sp.]
MALLLDIFGYLSVLLRGAGVIAQSLTIGALGFLLLVARPLVGELGSAGRPLLRSVGRVLSASALALAVVTVAAAALQTATLAGSTGLSVTAAASAEFVVAAEVRVLGAVMLALLAGFGFRRWSPLAFSAPMVMVLAAGVATGHGAARLDDRAIVVALDALHQLGAGLWIGGIPCFLIALVRCPDGPARRRVAARFSAISMAGVGAIVLGAGGMAAVYFDSFQAVYGTSYGIMAATKLALFAGLLALGLMNFLVVRRLRRDPAAPVLRLRRFAEVELGVGLAVMLAAASLTTLPPAIDLPGDRATLTEIADRLAPAWPRLISPEVATLSIPRLQARLDAEAAAAGTAHRHAYVPGAGVPPPQTAEDLAWSEFNHHWAGIAVLAIGALALFEGVGWGTGWFRWTRHWPLVFVVLAVFLGIRSDPKAWPLGEIGFLASLRDPEALQHRLYILLIAGFGLWEWRVRRAPLRRPRAALVFPVLTAVGGTLLLTHAHSLTTVKQEFLVELTHLPVALLGIAAGWARWLELRLEPPGSRVAAVVWPVCFVLTGLVLLAYREG